MRQQKSFGRRGQSGGPQNRPPVFAPRPIHEAVDGYEDPVLTRFAANKPWPAFAAAWITLAILGTTLYSIGDLNPQTLLFLVPVLLIAGFIMFLQFKGLQKGLQGDKEKRKRAIQAKYPLVPIFGMIGGLVYFMVTKDQSLPDIFGYDWSGIFGLRTGIEGEEPLTAQLFDTMATGGGAGIALAVLWYKVTKNEPVEEPEAG
jgi:hypothetical protein